MSGGSIRACACCDCRAGEVFVAAFGLSAVACFQPFVDELGRQSTLLQGGVPLVLRRAVRPPAGDGVVAGQVIASLEELLARPELVDEVRPGSLWALVSDENSRASELERARSLLADRAGMISVVSDPTGPEVAVARGIACHPGRLARHFADSVVEPKAFELVRERLSGRIVTVSLFEMTIKPEPEAVTERFLAAEMRHWLGPGEKRPQRVGADLELLLTLQPARAGTKLSETRRLEMSRPVPGRNPIRAEGHILPGPSARAAEIANWNVVLRLYLCWTLDA
ncbi:MAG: hypothetical protein R6V58_06040 [Planctomycetota bacterium]